MENSSIEDLNFLEATAAVTGVSGSLSVLSSFLIIFLFWDKKESHTIYLLKLLSLSNLLYSAAIVMGTIRYTDRCLWNNVVYCKAQAFILTWFGTASFFWTTFIALHATLITVKSSNMMEKGKSKIVCSFTAWIVPLIAVYMDALGEMKSNFSHTWCWVDGTLSPIHRIIWILLAGKGWEILAYLGTSVLCLAGLFVHLQHRQRKKKILDASVQLNKSWCLEQPTDIRDEFATKHNVKIWIGFYLYLPRIWGTIRYMAEIVQLATGKEDPSYQKIDNSFLFFVQCLGDSGQPIVNFIIFCLLNEDNRKLMKSKMKKIYRLICYE